MLQRPNPIRTGQWILSILFCLLCTEALAGSVYIGGAGMGVAAPSVSVDSFQEQRLQATVLQAHDFSCGSAALATLLTYNYNNRVSEKNVFEDMIRHGDKKTISVFGFSLLDLKRYLKRRGLRAEGFRAPLSKLAAVHLPAIVLIKELGYSHFVVIEGLNAGWVLLADPASGMRTEQVGKFRKEWNGVFFLILNRVRAAQRTFNSRRNWATAPRPPWSLARYAVDLGTLAQPAMLSPGRF